MARIHFTVTSYGSTETHRRTVDSIDDLTEALSVMKSDPAIGAIDVEFLMKTVAYKGASN